MSDDNREGVCISGKVRYADDVQAAIALERVREARRENPDGKAPERMFYECGMCAGWHLSSRELVPDLPAEKPDGESWKEYAHRLERRIKYQRDTISSLVEDGKIGNRWARKRIARLERALGAAHLRLAEHDENWRIMHDKPPREEEE